MKIYKWLGVAFASMWMVSCGEVCAIEIVGSGKIVMEERPCKTYSSLQISRGVDVVLVRSDSMATIRVEADEQILQYVTTEVNAVGCLKVTISDKVRKNKNCLKRVTIPCSALLSQVKVSSGAQLRFDEMYVANVLAIQATSGADVEVACRVDSCTFQGTSGAEIKVDVCAQKCSVQMESGAKTSMCGMVNTCHMSASSGAECEGEKLVVKQADVQASSGAKVNITCEEVIDVAVSSGGKINYWGDGVQRSAKISLGTVNHKTSRW
jgi:hypothetical protein